MIVLYPPEIHDISYVKYPRIFLAGPIQGAPNWQEEALEILCEHRDDLIVTCPRNADDWHGDYVRQVQWETFYLKEAGSGERPGVILFWLAKEEEHTCERAYAQTSRFELGEWFGRGLLHRLSVGIEEGFSNERYIRTRAKQACFKVYSSLKSTCLNTLDKIEMLEKA